MSVTKAIIITADDLGRWPEVNDAVMAGYDAGVVSSASLRVSCPSSHSAVVSAAQRPGLGVGLHLVLCNGPATLPRKHIPDLVDSNGRFVSKPLEAAWLYRKRAGLREELKNEIRAQIEKFLSSGLFLSHVSSAYSLHLHPTVIAILKELAEQYPISAIRKPCASIWRSGRQYAAPTWRRPFETHLMRPVMSWGKARSRVFIGPDRVEPLVPSRPATEFEVVDRINSARHGVTEFVCYPGSLSARYDGFGEEAVVTSRTVQSAIQETDAELISYRDLAEGTDLASISTTVDSREVPRPTGEELGAPAP